MSVRYKLLALGLSTPAVNFVVAACIERKTHEEIAAEYGCTRENVTQCIMTARKRLQIGAFARTRGRPTPQFRPESSLGLRLADL